MISLVMAVNKNLAVGKNGDLVHKIKADLQHFKKLTQGKKILMGRPSLESLKRLLPNRHHIILTTDVNYDIPESFKKGLSDNTTYEIINTLEDIIKYNQYNDETEIVCIGGAKLANTLIQRFSKLHLTLIDSEEEGDTHIDNWDLSLFDVIEETEYTKDEETGLNYKYLTLQKVYR